ncbi:hypothetical protein B0T26DRAFT_510049 [Lasiosphaeria miniovina]|uniref:Uncharacterized protein n=1 Tax=Lasiosphaeria miniovina TaxID=1954250 RepID=A0AA39ZUE4_9PEZI|nr:uncharacterized protein B0T26DRAFT_510049 [Lasiosphaeria miniovina]KAK0703734.1 hypothetical protein B0T26DRAFT_510049 [Lasiosphaeria miniovina]
MPDAARPPSSQPARCCCCCCTSTGLAKSWLRSNSDAFPTRKHPTARCVMRESWPICEFGTDVALIYRCRPSLSSSRPSAEGTRGGDGPGGERLSFSRWCPPSTSTIPPRGNRGRPAAEINAPALALAGLGQGSGISSSIRTLLRLSQHTTSKLMLLPVRLDANITPRRAGRDTRLRRCSWVRSLPCLQLEFRERGRNLYYSAACFDEDARSLQTRLSIYA